MPYHLATPLYLTKDKAGAGAEAPAQSPYGMGWVKGLEPSTPGTTIRCSNQLSYTHHIWLTTGTPGTPEGTRTPDPLLRRQLLYPPELQAHLERVMGIEPTRPAWKAGILPLNYTRMDGAFLSRQLRNSTIFHSRCQWVLENFPLLFCNSEIKPRALRLSERPIAEGTTVHAAVFLYQRRQVRLRLSDTPGIGTDRFCADFHNRSLIQMCIRDRSIPGPLPR